MVPQLPQGFLQPPGRGGMGNPQRLQAGIDALTAEAGVGSAKTVGTGQERVGESLDTDRGFGAVSAVDDG